MFPSTRFHEVKHNESTTPPLIHIPHINRRGDGKFTGWVFIFSKEKLELTQARLASQATKLLELPEELISRVSCCGTLFTTVVTLPRWMSVKIKSAVVIKMSKPLQQSHYTAAHLWVPYKLIFNVETQYVCQVTGDACQHLWSHRGPLIPHCLTNILKIWIHLK